MRIALGAIRSNTARGVLTGLGIVIGVLAVSTTMTAANGLDNAFRESGSVLGTDVLYVSRTPWVFTGRFFNFRNRPPVSLKDCDKLAQHLDPGAVVNPIVSTQRSLKFGSQTAESLDVLGTTERHMLVSSAVPETGRFLNAHDVRYKKRVCVIGSEVRERLFEGADPINKNMKIGRDTFRVVGVMEEQGSAGFFGGPDFDSQVFIPVTTFTRVLGGSHRDFDIAVKAPPGRDLDEFSYEVVGKMRTIRRLRPAEDDNFAINQMDNLVTMFNNVMGVVLLVGMMVTGVSLFVGGVGVTNIMFVSVAERTREIGIRKALGAKTRAILKQFLYESSVICLIGGAVGVALAYAVASLIDRLLMPASVSLPIVVVALLVSIAVGVFAGMIPALRAARLSPIEALRYE